MNELSFLGTCAGGSLLKVYIQPGAKGNGIVGIHDDRLKIKIKGQPVDGEANKELISYLSKCFRISKSKMSILRGDTSRKKDLEIEISPSELGEKLRTILNT